MKRDEYLIVPAEDILEVNVFLAELGMDHAMVAPEDARYSNDNLEAMIHRECIMDEAYNAFLVIATGREEVLTVIEKCSEEWRFLIKSPEWKVEVTDEGTITPQQTEEAV